MIRALPALLLLVAGCTVGAPPGFSGGDSWSFPLVGPLEGGPLVVPVKVHDKGPYLFVIDPDSPHSQIDGALVSELDLRSGIGPEYVDESDKGRQLRLAEVLRLSIGDLTIRSKDFWVTDVGTFNTAGRQIRGVIGKDILADSLVFGFDRQAGMAYLATQKGFQPPANATSVGWRRQKTRITTGVPAVSRRIVGVQVGGASLQMHVDLGDAHSQLREGKWAAAGLAPVDVRRTLIDEAGTRREVTRGAVAGAVRIGDATVNNVLFVPFGDRRWEETEVDGTIGLGAFDGHQVWADFDSDRLFLAPAEPVEAGLRIARWGSAQLQSCAVPACTTAKLLVPEAPAEPAPADPAAGAPAPVTPPPAPPAKPILHVERTADVADLPFEVTIEARAPSGAATALPRMIAIFPAGTTQVTQALDDRFADATFEVVDVSPFPRACAREGACIYLLGEVQ